MKNISQDNLTILHETGHFLIYYHLSSKYEKKKAEIILYSNGPIRGKCRHGFVKNKTNKLYVSAAGIAAEMWLLRHLGKFKESENLFNRKIFYWKKDLSDITKIKLHGITKPSDIRQIIENIIVIFERHYTSILLRSIELDLQENKYYNVYELYRDLLP